MDVGAAYFTDIRNFRVYQMDFTYQNDEPKYNFEFDLTATDKGFAAHLYLVNYKEGTDGYEYEWIKTLIFSNHDPEYGDGLENPIASQTFIWNGKKYKSVSVE